ncbi:MAG: signal transduction protein [Dechloromonas sp.]|nr:MAG: signal transduction protein [Dechloromonas sp.]
MDESDAFLPAGEQDRLLAELAGLEALDAAPELAARLRHFLFAMAGRGLDGQAMTRLVSACNDRLSQRLIILVSRKHRLPSVDWCWLAMGSEGRYEQTFVTDQDNGLVFNASDGREADALRELFLPFAREVNQRLADCGFALCSGQIMAGNPDWCLSFDEWRERFIDWVRRPEPTALLNATIFFDLRPLFGQQSLAERLRTLILALTTDTPVFQHLLAANALQAGVPLNFRGVLAADEEGGLDLKKSGSRIFVDAARILALATGVAAVNTGERLRLAGREAGMTPGEIAAAEAAFSHVLRLRLAQQLRDRSGDEVISQGFKPSALHEVDSAILLESLRQARRLQQRLKLNYAL